MEEIEQTFEVGMKEKPILFSGEMVRAILDGRKTQSRRVVKPQPDMVSKKGESVVFKTIERINPETRDFETLTHVPGEPHKKYCRQIKCPFGEVDDRLWVRETFAILSDGNIKYKTETFYPEANVYIAGIDGRTGKPVKWKPSIHMPRAASRITLEITDVWVERLNDISEKDAMAEGLESFCPGLDYPRHELRTAFQNLWDSDNKKHPWASNPWVWVLEFKLLK
jgi:hypothetical protein